MQQRRRPPQTSPAEPPAPDAPEHVKARWWREHVAHLSRKALAERIGFSPSAINNYERGYDRSKHIPMDYGRYRLLCGAVAANIEFDWLSLSVELDGERVTIRFDEG